MCRRVPGTHQVFDRCSPLLSKKKKNVSANCLRGNLFEGELGIKPTLPTYSLAFSQGALTTLETMVQRLSGSLQVAKVSLLRKLGAKCGWQTTKAGLPQVGLCGLEVGTGLCEKPGGRWVQRKLV